ncbi:MAG: radical SAM family heme chaperone HemW [Planctomycetes bacterium]|nr:radical SAM family heme chaperone HemW [Planctomycetota bacterium]
MDSTLPLKTTVQNPVHHNESTGVLQGIGTSAALVKFVMPRKIAGLYVHVPFCFHKCHYCDFYSIVDDADRQARFVDRMLQEAAALARDIAVRPVTIFVGGGTPTLLRPDLWQRLLAGFQETFDLSGIKEFTVEANPETVTPELLDVLVSGGVNRMSIGCQSFNMAHLKTLERWHDPANVERAMSLARAAGIDNLNLDLIFAIPGQTLGEWREDLARAIALGPRHLSCYSLMYEPNTPLTKKLELGRLTRMDEELEAAMYEATIDDLAAAGFEQYEISNWAKLAGAEVSASQIPLPPGEVGPEGRVRVRPITDCTRNETRPASGPPSPQPSPGGRGGFAERASWRCLHNMAYWLNENWLALGPSASGHLNGVRWKNAPHLGRYLADSAGGGVPIQDVERLDDDASRGEQLMLRLRLIDGVERSWLAPMLTRQRLETIDRQIAAGMLVWSNDRLRLTRAGLLLADHVIADLI